MTESNANTEPSEAQQQAIVHTPGPWTPDADENQRLIVKSGNQTVAALTQVDDTTQTEANLWLIAAAPELLAALQQCLMNIEQDEYTHNRLFGAGNVARDAIEKATGVRPAEVV